MVRHALDPDRELRPRVDPEVGGRLAFLEAVFQQLAPVEPGPRGGRALVVPELAEALEQRPALDQTIEVERPAVLPREAVKKGLLLHQPPLPDEPDGQLLVRIG